MGVAALILLILAVLGGTGLLAELGPRLRGHPTVRAIVTSHVALASITVILWLVALVGGSGALSWLSVALLVVVAALGISALVRSSPGSTAVDDPAAVAAGVSPTVIVIHGVLAAAALIAVVIAAAV